MVEEEKEEVSVEKEIEKSEEQETPKQAKSILWEYKSVSPFPSRPRYTKRKRKDEEIMDTLQKMEVSIPLLESNKTNSSLR